MRGPEGSELIRLENAFLALTGLEPPSISEIAARLNGSLMVHESRQDDELGMVDSIEVVHAKPPRPVRAAVKELLASSDRVWSFDDMLRQFNRQGEQFRVKSLRDALRTAVLQLVNEKSAERVGKGRYRGISTVSATEARGSLPSLGDGEG